MNTAGRLLRTRLARRKRTAEAFPPGSFGEYLTHKLEIDPYPYIAASHYTTPTVPSKYMESWQRELDRPLNEQLAVCVREVDMVARFKHAFALIARDFPKEFEPVYTVLMSSLGIHWFG